MADDNQQQIAYNKAVADQQMAYRLFNDARYNQRNPYLSQQTPAVQRYYNYYQNKDEMKITKENEAFKQQVQKEQQRLNQTTGPLTKQQVATARATEDAFMRSKATKTIVPIQQQIIQGPSQQSSFDFSNFNKQSNVLKSDGQGAFTAAVNVGNGKMQDYIFGYKGSQITSAKGLGTPMDIGYRQPFVNLVNGKPSLQQFMQPQQNSLISAFNEGQRATKNVSPIGQNIISGSSSPISINITPLPTSNRNNFLEFIKPPTTALTPVIQQAQEFEQVRKELGMNLYNQKTFSQSIIETGFNTLDTGFRGSINPFGLGGVNIEFGKYKPAFELSGTQQEQNIGTFNYVKDIISDRKQFYANPLAYQSKEGVNTKTTQKGYEITLTPEYYEKNFSSRKEYLKSAHQQFLLTPELQRRQASLFETEMIFEKTAIVGTEFVLSFYPSFLTVEAPGTKTYASEFKFGGNLGRVRETPTNPLLQLTSDIGTIGMLSLGPISNSIKLTSGTALSTVEKLEIGFGSLSLVQFQRSPGIPNIIKQFNEINPNEFVINNKQIVRTYDQEAPNFIGGPTKIYGSEALSRTTGNAEGLFRIDYPNVQFISGEQGFKTTRMTTGDFGVLSKPLSFGPISKSGQTIFSYGDIYGKPMFPTQYKEISSARQDFKVLHYFEGESYKVDMFRLVTGKEQSIVSRVGINTIEVNHGLNIDMKFQGLSTDLTKSYTKNLDFTNFNPSGPKGNLPKLDLGSLTGTSTKSISSFAIPTTSTVKSTGMEFPKSSLVQPTTRSPKYSGQQFSQSFKGYSATVEIPKSSLDLGMGTGTSTIQKNTGVTKLNGGSSSASRNRNRYGSGIGTVFDEPQGQKIITSQLQIPINTGRNKTNQRSRTNEQFISTNFMPTSSITTKDFLFPTGGFGFGLPKSLGGIPGFGMKGKGFSYRNVKPSFTAVALNLKGSFPKSMSIGNLNLGISPGELRLLPGERSRKKGKKSRSKKSTFKRPGKKRR